jgi:very-short-patch-repair endonuclease
MRRGPTDAESAIWQLLRNRRLAAYKFRRQFPFQNYILDFVCFDQRLVVEIDGSQHASSQRDKIREAVLKQEGFRVLRYWNNDVLKQPKAILEDLFAHLNPGNR